VAQIWKNTVKCILTGNQQKPSPAEIHRWIADTLKLTIVHTQAIQLDTLEGAVNIKLESRHQMDNLLMATSDKSSYYADGTQKEIMLVPADLNTVTVRVFNVPLEMGNERITSTVEVREDSRHTKRKMVNRICFSHIQWYSCN
jgi:hypothetical protein